ncbi:GumC family protein [Oryzibacter oryziterrae]|uniref:GumC family protein n=1 Tax=Oryzibacter oryziterrae TaxID=2766474 RepID=UPI001F2C78E5|nr:GumC family protein [Oryzibacter oryziterrae]
MSRGLFKRAARGVEAQRAPVDAVTRPSVAPLAVSESGDVDLGMLFAILLRQWLLIGLITALFIAAGVGFLLVTPKTWQSTARVLLDPRDKQITAGADVVQPVQGIDTVWISTQADLVTSSATLEAVVEKLHLDKDPEFGGTRDSALLKLAESIGVERADQTYVLNINAFAHDPGRATLIAQAVADAFIDSMVVAKANAVREASKLINTQLDDLRSKARAAQEKLEAYKRDHGIVSANGRSVDEDTLRQLNDAYVAATVKTQQAKSRLDSIQKALRAGDTSDSLLDSLSSTVISRLKIEKALAARSVSDLSQALGPSHPRMLAAKADLARAEAQIADELRSMAASAANEVEAAKTAEAAAKMAVDRAGAVVADAGEANILLNELQNDATLRNDMYKNYVARTEEIGLQAHTQISDARVIVPASRPLYPYAPRKPIVLALAGMAGLGIALSMALYRGRRYLVRVPVNDAEARAQGPKLDAAEPEDDDLPSREAPPMAAALSSPSDVPVLAEFTVAAPLMRTARHSREDHRALIVSAVEAEDGTPRTEALADCARLIRRVERAAGHARMLLVVGIGEGEAATAIAYGLASLPVEAGLLLVDATAALPVAAAWSDRPLPGIAEVQSGTASAADIALYPEGQDITVVGTGAIGSQSAQAEAVGRFIADLGADYGRVIVHCGTGPAQSLIEALAADADAVILVADRVIEDDPEAGAMVSDLADALDVFTGLVLVSGRDSRASHRTKAA